MKEIQKRLLKVANFLKKLANVNIIKYKNVVFIKGDDLSDMKNLLDALGDLSYFSRSKGLDNEYMIVSKDMKMDNTELQKLLHKYISKDQGWL